MQLNEIKAAVESGKTVHWKTNAYNVIKDRVGQFLIVCPSTKGCWGLTWADNVTMNGKPEEFYVEVDREHDGAAKVIVEYSKGVLIVTHAETGGVLVKRPSSGAEWLDRIWPTLSRMM